MIKIKEVNKIIIKKNGQTKMINDKLLKDEKKKKARERAKERKRASERENEEVERKKGNNSMAYELKQ